MIASWYLTLICWAGWGWVMGVTVWQLRDREMRQRRALVVCLTILAPLFALGGKAIERAMEGSASLSWESAERPVLMAAVSLSFALLSARRIRASARLQQKYRLQSRTIRYSLTELLALMTLVALVAASAVLFWRMWSSVG